MLSESSKYSYPMLDKPDDSIPADEWEALSQQERDFAHFIYDIYDHFDLVVKEKLGWKPTNIKINQGKGNIVIGFESQGQGYVFRVPKYGIRQLQIIMCIRRTLGDKPYFPNVFYYDDKCLIERYVDGERLSESTSPDVFAKLAAIISDIHSLPGRGFGPLRYKNYGIADDIESYYTEEYFQEEWNNIRQHIQPDPEILQTLQRYWRSLLHRKGGEFVICHGDLWCDNALYDDESAKLTLIDWDTCGIYHREKDLHFLISPPVTEEQRHAFFSHYPYDVDQQWLHWYRFTMQLKYWRAEKTSYFIDSANDFLSIMGSDQHLTDNSSTSRT